MIIDIGCGPNPKDDADVYMDINNWPKVNLLHDLLVVPYPLADNTFDKLYFGDVIEHISVFDIDSVLKEMLRICKPEGIVEVTCPDIRWICERIIKGDWKDRTIGHQWLNKYKTDFDNAMMYVFGGWYDKNEKNMAGMGHISGHDETSLIHALTRSGWKNAIRQIDDRHESILKVRAVK